MTMWNVLSTTVGRPTTQSVVGAWGVFGVYEVGQLHE